MDGPFEHGIGGKWTSRTRMDLTCFLSCLLWLLLFGFLSLLSYAHILLLFATKPSFYTDVLITTFNPSSFLCSHSLLQQPQTRILILFAHLFEVCSHVRAARAPLRVEGC